MGKIYQVKDSPYHQVEYYDSAGKRQRKSTRKKDKRAAEIVLATLEVETASEVASGQPVTHRRFSDAIAEYLAARHADWSDKWHSTANGWVGHRLSPALGNQLVSRITKEEIEALRGQWLREGLAKSSVNRLTAVGSGFYRWAIERKYASFNPFARHKHFIEAGKHFQYHDDPTLLRVLGHINDRLRPAALFSLDTAVRRSECQRIRWPHINLDQRVVWIEPGKTGKGRELPLTARTVAMLRVLKELPAARPGGFAFPRLPDKTINDAMKRATAKAEVENFTWHGWRHYGLTRFAEAGATIAELMAFAGWKSIAMAIRYVHTDKDRVRATVAKMESAISLPNFAPKDAKTSKT